MGFFFFPSHSGTEARAYGGCSWKTACPGELWQSVKHAGSLATRLSQLRQHTLTFLLFTGTGGSTQPSPACAPGNPTPRLNRAAGRARTTSPPESRPCRCNPGQPAWPSRWGPTRARGRQLNCFHQHPGLPRRSRRHVMTGPIEVMGKDEEKSQHRQKSFPSHAAARGQQRGCQQQHQGAPSAGPKHRDLPMGRLSWPASGQATLAANKVSQQRTRAVVLRASSSLFTSISFTISQFSAILQQKSPEKH